MKDLQLVNCTPHAINIIDGPTIPPSGIVARVKATTVKVGDINGIPVTATMFGEVENLPEPEFGTIYIVSSLVAQARPDRDDLFIPNESVRDDQGRIIGCRSLGCI